MDCNPDNGRDAIEGGRNTVRTQDRQSSTKAAQVHLGHNRQVFRVESLYARGNKCRQTGVQISINTSPADIAYRTVKSQNKMHNSQSCIVSQHN